MKRRDFLTLAGGVATASVTSSAVFGLDFPTSPIKIIVPFPAGGPTDSVARIIADNLQSSLGQACIVENVTGGGGSLGIDRVVHAAADGYTLSVGNWASHVGMSATYPVKYDVLNDLEPVALLAAEPQLIVVGQSFPANNLSELIEWLRSNPDKGLMGTAGVGSASHVAGIYFQQKTGARFQFVPYRGSVPVMQALLSGQVHLSFGLGATSLPQIRAGTIKAFAVTNSTRIGSAPEVPTVDEAGLPGLYFSVWNAMWSPKQTPRSVVEKLNSAVGHALNDPAVNQKLNEIGQEITPITQRSPEALGRFHQAEAQKWWPIIKAAGIKVE